MSSKTTTPDLCYIVYMPDGPEADCDLFELPEGARVVDLKAAIRHSWSRVQNLKDDELILLKCVDLSMGTRAERFKSATEWLRKHGGSGTARMEPAHRLKRYFPSGPAPEDDEKIDIIVATHSILESPDVLYALPDLRASKAIKERVLRAKEMGNFPSPSEGVKSEEKVKEWVNVSSGVHPHRPTGNYGPSTSLFHPALARLKHRLTHLNQIEEPSAEYYKWAHTFITLGGNGYTNETIREAGLKLVIHQLIGGNPKWQEQIQGGKAIPDAVWGEIVRAILELKNLDGVGGNAVLQGTLVYAKVLAQPKYKKYLEISNCPVILIGIMGSRLEISTAIFTDGIYTDKLFSEDLYIDAWQSDTVYRVGRIFKALSLSIAELRDYYETLVGNPNPEPITTRLYPTPLPVEGLHNPEIPQLNYLGKLSHAGDLLREEDEELGQLERPYALYRAKMVQGESGGEVDVVVKFTVRYNEKAHRILADNQLAPPLHCCIPLMGGMFMVVMDYVEGASLFQKRPQDLGKVHRDVKRAVDLLHQQGLVFGDLRIQNVMSKATGDAVLIDFDWVGEHLVDRYPASWNSDKTWAPGVERRALMDKAHDIFMLEKMKASLGLAT